MELLQGLDLQTLVDENGPMHPARVVHTLIGVCRSLADAHMHRLVHRDIKPSNVFLARLGTELDFVKVLDFGLVKPEVDELGESPEISLSRGDVIPGTPAYLAPESVMSRKIDHRADLYSLGCTAYFMLTGQVVFTGKTPVAVAMQHVQETPVPVSERAERPIPPALEAIVMKCLAKSPSDRFLTASDLEEELAHVAATLPWTDEDALRWWEAYEPDVLQAPTPGLSSVL
jgi:serine/threonine-protein kinase